MTALSRPEISGVAGVPETLVSDALLASLPANEAPAPWTVRSQAVIWYARGGGAATQALPPALRTRHRGLAVVGGVVRYDETPVGPYDEVFGLVGSRDGRKGFGTVTFMAVDSPASIVGGRANWGMPKTLGSFEGAIGSGRTMTADGADGADAVGWRVSVTPRVLGPRVPLSMKATTRQEVHGGRVGDSRLDGKARLSPALVKVEVESDGDLAGWLRPGWHLGAVVEECTFTLGPPTYS
jgi:hypothetical protein